MTARITLLFSSPPPYALKRPQHPLRIPRSGAHQTLLSRNYRRSLIIFISDCFFFLTTILQHVSSVDIFSSGALRILSR